MIKNLLEWNQEMIVKFEDRFGKEPWKKMLTGALVGAVGWFVVTFTIGFIGGFTEGFVEGFSNSFKDDITATVRVGILGQEQTEMTNTYELKEGTTVKDFLDDTQNIVYNSNNQVISVNGISNEDLVWMFYVENTNSPDWDSYIVNNNETIALNLEYPY